MGIVSEPGGSSGGCGENKKGSWRERCHDMGSGKAGGIKRVLGREVLVLTDYGCSSPPPPPPLYDTDISLARCSTPNLMKSVVQFLCSGHHVTVNCVKKKNRKLNCLHQVRNKVYSAFFSGNCMIFKT